jgi:hypothetical protein
MFHWLHHLLNPHCPICREAAEENKVCTSCETLKTQLAIANDEKRMLLNAVLVKPAPEAQPTIDYEKVKPKMMTWNVRKQMLEAEDRKTAQILADKRADEKINKDIEKLEKELNIESEVKSDA